MDSYGIDEGSMNRGGLDTKLTPLTEFSEQLYSSKGLVMGVVNPKTGGKA